MSGDLYYPKSVIRQYGILRKSAERYGENSQDATLNTNRGKDIYKKLPTKHELSGELIEYSPKRLKKGQISLQTSLR